MSNEPTIFDQTVNFLNTNQRLALIEAAKAFLKSESIAAGSIISNDLCIIVGTKEQCAQFAKYL